MFLEERGPICLPGFSRLSFLPAHILVCHSYFPSVLCSTDLTLPRCLHYDFLRQAQALVSAPAVSPVPLGMCSSFVDPSLCSQPESMPASDDGDFRLEDAFGPTEKPLPTQKAPSDNDGFSLEDALQPGDPKPGPPAKPRDSDNPKPGSPAKPRDSGSFDDSDLYNGDLPRAGGGGGGGSGQKDSGPNKVEDGEASQGAIAGIVSAVVATVIGAVSSFIAYQKKKLCFKQSADEENVNMDSHRGAQSEPPVQRTLLEN
uniref:CD99 molecule (Xg blood group) n=1 Tax=Anser brachyrhynchus TaxID=132585 RepID=A0A8B9CKB4_9AVES